MLFEVLETEMLKKRITGVEISNKLNFKTPQTFSNKKLGKTEFTREEMIIIRDTWFKEYSLEELFRKKEIVN